MGAYKLVHNQCLSLILIPFKFLISYIHLGRTFIQNYKQKEKTKLKQPAPNVITNNIKKNKTTITLHWHDYMMSSKGRNALDSKGSGKTSAQSRKNNRRRSQRNVSLSNGDQDGDSKERASKRGRDANKDDYGYDEYSQEVYKVSIFVNSWYIKNLKTRKKKKDLKKRLK